MSIITIQTKSQSQDEALRTFLLEAGIEIIEAEWYPKWLKPISHKEQKELETLLNNRSKEDQELVMRRIRKAK